MKTIAFCAALAFTTGAVFAQDTSPAAAPAEMNSASSAPMQADAHKKSHHKARKSAKARRSGTRSMGASAAPVETDLSANARRARMDEAYANWRAKQ